MAVNCETSRKELSMIKTPTPLVIKTTRCTKRPIPLVTVVVIRNNSIDNTLQTK